MTGDEKEADPDARATRSDDADSPTSSAHERERRDRPGSVAADGSGETDVEREASSGASDETAQVERDDAPLDAARAELSAILTDTDRSLADRRRAALAVAADALALDGGLVTTAEPGSSPTVVTATGSLTAAAATWSATGLHRRVEGEEPTVARHDATESTVTDGLPDGTPVGRFVGAPLRMTGGRSGVVVFVGRESRGRPFTAAERTFVDLVARLLEREEERDRTRDERRDREDVVERQRRELAQVSTKYDTLRRAAPEAVLLVHAGTETVVEVNEAAGPLFGCDSDAVLGRTLAELFPADEEARYREALERFVHVDGSRSTFDDGTTLCVADDDGTRVPVELSVEELDLDGETHLQLVCRNVTDRNLRVRRLEESEQMFRNIAAASTDVIFRLATDGRFTYVSDAVTDVLGYAPEDLVGEPFRTIVGDRDPRSIMLTFVRVLEGTAIDGIGVPARTADGDTVHLEINATPVYGSGADGEEAPVVGAQGIARDVTERRERQRELRRKNRAVDAADIGITIADATRPDDPVVYTNDRFEELTGYTADDVVGRTFFTLQGDQTRTETVSELRRAIDEGESTTVELVHYRRDGAPFWNRLSVTPVADEDGTLTHYVGFHQNVTERKRRERLIEVLNRVLRHNLRNTMMVVEGYAQVLINDLDEAKAGHAETILEEAQSLTALAEKARSLREFGGGEREVRDVIPVVEEVLDELDREFPSLSIRRVLPDECRVVADDGLRAALRELGENAALHAGGAPTLTVGVETRDDEFTEITLADDGPGLPDQERNVLEHARETPLEHGGGLGLWTVNWLVTGMGGRVTTNPEARGTNVTIHLRRERDD